MTIYLHHHNGQYEFRQYATDRPYKFNPIYHKGTNPVSAFEIDLNNWKLSAVILKAKDEKELEKIRNHFAQLVLFSDKFISLRSQKFTSILESGFDVTAFTKVENGVIIYSPEVKVTSELPGYDMISTIIQDHIKSFVKKQDDFIMERLKKQPGFISIEESKHLIEVNNMIHNSAHVGTDYLFNGRRFLTIYPTEYEGKAGEYGMTFNYKDYTI